MSALALRRAASREEPANEEPATLDLLAAQILRNRFLPVPPPESVYVGDGDFLAVGVEFLKWFVELGGLAPHERVLDLGCGIGRMAVPLTQYLEGGSYDGVDIATTGIDWCRATITPRYDNFRFHHLDLAHPLYNPGGTSVATAIRLPFPDGAFDFIAACSVVTHLDTVEVAATAREIRRVMAPGARCLITAFMLNAPAREGLRAGAGALAFDGADPAPVLYADPANATAAIAFEEDHFLGTLLAAGLRRSRPPVYGRWSGRPTPGPSFQDINIFEIDTPMPTAFPSSAR
jgi:SAM-dependent methyltransferase